MAATERKHDSATHVDANRMWIGNGMIFAVRETVGK